MGRTVHIRYESGHETDIDIPDEGTMAYEHWLDHLATGRIVVLDDPQAEVDEVDETFTVDGDYPSGGTISQILDWVHGDTSEDGEPSDGFVERATVALDAEQSAGDQARKRLIAVLDPIVNPGVAIDPSEE